MDLRTFLLVSASSAVWWLCSFLFLVPRASAMLVPGYKILTASDRIIWNNKAMSVLNAVLTGTVAAVALLLEELPKLYNGTLWEDSSVIHYTASTNVGYLLVDTGLLLRNPGMTDHGILIHHVIIVVCILAKILLDFGPPTFFNAMRMIQEVSNPFLHFRWLLTAMGVSRNSRIYVTNGLLFAASFLLSRIFPIPFYWTQSLQLIASPQTYARFGAVGLGFWFVADLLFDGINCYWAVKICKGTYKFMKTRKLE
ncbi:TLC domain-containing protein 4-B-like isoform X1 [Branchiostoma floridae x Branchiostoma belcheri]